MVVKAATYISGETICENDYVMYGNMRGKVVQVMCPGSVQAGAYDCAETGGFSIQFENGHFQVWIDADEDLIFLGRSGTPKL